MAEDCIHLLDPAHCVVCLGHARPAAPSETSGTFPARYPGLCRTCGFGILVGDDIVGVDGAYVHADCDGTVPW